MLGWVADDFFHCGLALSAPMQVDPLSLNGVRGALWVQEDVDPESNYCVGEGRGADIIEGHPLNSLAWLANSEVAHAMGGLPRGWVVSLGSVTQTQWVKPHPSGVTVKLKFGQLGARAEGRKAFRQAIGIAGGSELGCIGPPHGQLLREMVVRLYGGEYEYP